MSGIRTWPGLFGRGGTEKPVIIRWGQEMDETDNQFSWSHWRGEDFKAAYRHVVGVCRGHLKNAKFMWSPKGNEGLDAFYPGDDVVDIVGFRYSATNPTTKARPGALRRSWSGWRPVTDG